MKIKTWLCLVCSISINCPTLAFDSQVSGGINLWASVEEYEEDSGFSSEGDYSGSEIFGAYTHFLTPVQDNGEPLGLLPFFYSRSSYVYGNLYTGGWDFDEDDTGYSSEKDWTGIGFGGLFYLTPDTGIGASYLTQNGDWEDNDAFPGDSYDEDRDRWSVWLRQYINQHNRVSISVSQTDRDREADNGFERSDIYRWLVLSYGGVLGSSSNIYLGASIGQGSREREQSNGFEQDHDLTSYGLTVGPVFRRFALYFSWDYIEWDPDGDTWKGEETSFAVAPRFWVSEQLMLGGEVYTWTWKDWIDNNYDYEEIGLGTEFLVRYRF